MPLTLTRRVTFVAKAEYFNTPGIKGWFQKKFFYGAGQVPIDRSGAGAGEGALNAAKKVLDSGELFGIYPEGPAPTTASSTAARPVSRGSRSRPARP
jgi:1-acyl-sn-glycerol-3-phosphate acyltransferase